MFQTTEGQSALLSEVGNLDRFFESAVLAVEFAGHAINEVVRKHGSQILESESKTDGSPVSKADQAAHAVLVKHLTACSPFPIVSEEDPRGVPQLPSVIDQPFFWLADPLDGTRDFLAGETTFAVALALMRVNNGVVTPYFGCIADPTLETSWWGSRETPLTKRIHSEVVDLPLAVSGEPGTDRKLRVLGSRSIPSERMNALYKFWDVEEITRMGSALKFALIAEGSADVYPRFGPTAEWDTAAGQLLLEITGGGLYSLESGQPMTYGKSQWRNHGFLAVGSAQLATEWMPKIQNRIQT
jgi:3'(2'), 5'-bisphosphate nucleotidase